MLYYRVEIYDKEEEKWNGLFSMHILDDQNILVDSPAYKHFEKDLPCINPHRFFKNHNKHCHCYFTNHGVSEFKDDIRYFMNIYAENNIETRLIVVDKKQYPATYIDDYQVVLADGEEIKS
jgi:hypothetical protein